jgi:hypothetical protein
LTPNKPADLRRIGYQSKSSTALKRINDALLATVNLSYIPKTLSRICAFYLPQSYSDELEIRLMVKRHKGGINQAINVGMYEVWPISLAAPGATSGNPWCEIEILEVTTGLHCTKAAAQSALANSIYSAVPVT